MEISKETIEILKNFAIINNSIFFDEEGTIKTMSIGSNIIGIATIPEKIPEFGIYDLQQFLGVITIFDLEKTDFDFSDKFVTIKSGRNRSKYLYTDMDLLENYGKIKPSEKYLSFDNFNSNFELNVNDISKLQRASSIMKLTHIDIDMKEGNGKIKISEEDTNVSNNFLINIEGEGNCKIAFSVDNLILVKGSYAVNVLDGKLIKFKHTERDLIYFVSPKIS